MDFASFGITGVAAITILCVLLGQVLKVLPMDNRYIPILVGFFGGILGVLGMFLTPDFPAEDYLTAIAVGVASGLASTGAHQVLKQLGSEHDDE